MALADEANRLIRVTSPIPIISDAAAPAVPDHGRGEDWTEGRQAEEDDGGTQSHYDRLVGSGEDRTEDEDASEREEDGPDDDSTT